MCTFLSIIIAFGAFVTMTFGNIPLSDWIDVKEAFAAGTLSPVPVFYRYGELVGIYRVNYSDTTTLQYKIGDNGTWKNYSVPFAIPAHQTTKVYARIGTSGRSTYMNFSTTADAIGVYSESNTDFELSYNGINFGYTRTYDSVTRNWFESIHSKVLATNSRLEVTLPDNTKIPMIRKNSNTYVDELTGKTLTKTNTNYIYNDTDYKYYFAINGVQSVTYLSAIEDYNGNRLNLNRTTNSNEISISDNSGRSFYISDYYGIEAPDDSDVNYYSVKEITDPNNNKIKYTTKQDHYISVVDQAGVKLGNYKYVSDAIDYTLTKSNDKSIEYYSNGRLKKITYDNGSWIQYTYTDSQKLYTTLTSSGETTRTIYNDAFKIIEYTDEYGTTTTYTYDDHYRVLTEVCDNVTTTYTYDANGNILSYTTSDSENNTYYTYDSNKRVVREQVGDEYTYYTYDSNGNNLVYAILKEDYVGTAPALYDSSLDCFDTVTYTYDNKGRVTSEVNSDGLSVSYTYDNRGNVLTETTVDTDNNQSTVTYTYDDMGNLLTSSTGNDTTSYIYDAAGRTLLENNNGECTRTLYDDLGRIVQEIGTKDYDSTKEGLPNANTYADSNVGQRYYYNDTTGNLDIEINRLDVETVYEYFETGEKKKEFFDIYEYNYDIKGNLTKVYVDGVNTLTYNYDEDYKLTSEVYANGQSIHYEYDDNNNLLRQYHDNDISPYVTYSYNEDNELTQKINTDTGLKTVYGENNSVTIYKVLDNSIVQSYVESITEADEENNIEAQTDVTETHFGTSFSSIVKNDSISYTTGNNEVKYTTVENDNRIISDSVKYNGSTKISSNYSYDSDNNISEKEVSLSNDTYPINNNYSNNKIISSGYGAANIFYSYDSNEQIKRVDNNYKHYTNTYTYDDRGNILTKKKYSYTRNDNITSTPNETTHFAYSNDGWNDKLISVNDTSLTYDANGNVLTYGNKSFNWSSGRNLSQIIDGENTYSYTYDESGIRTSKTVNGVTTYYNTKDGVILSQTDGTNTMYFQYDTSGVPIGFILNGTQYFYITNQMGDVLGITDSNSNAIAEYEYDEWGNVIDLQGMNNSAKKIANINPLRYRGYYYDDETDYYYLQSRYYDANICRFINSDLAEIAIITSERNNGINIFAYCNNDSINNVDSFGGFSSGVIKDVFNRMKTFIQKKIDYIIKEKLGISIRGNYLYLKRSTVGTAIDIGITVGSAITAAIKSTAIKATCRTIYEYAKNNSKKFADFITKKYIDDIAAAFVKITEISFSSFAKCAGRKIAISFAKDTIKSAIISNFPVWEWIESLKSPGNLIAIALDVITDKNIWNHEIRIKVK